MYYSLESSVLKEYKVDFTSCQQPLLDNLYRTLLTDTAKKTKTKEKIMYTPDALFTWIL